MASSVGSHTQGIQHDCHGAMDCAATTPGHGLALIQERVVSATPSKWRDALVLSVAPSGWVRLALIADDSTVAVWNHAELDAALKPGDPVALHSVYDVLAVGDSRLNVLLAEPAAR